MERRGVSGMAVVAVHGRREVELPIMKHLLIISLGVFVFLLVGCSGDGGGSGPSNHAPTIEAQRDTTAVLGDTLVLWARAYDSDGDDLTYKALGQITYEEFRRGYFPVAGMNQASGRFKFWPQEDDRPSRQFTFIADDERGGTDSTSFFIYVD
jgi:hypothetical protein